MSWRLHEPFQRVAPPPKGSRRADTFPRTGRCPILPVNRGIFARAVASFGRFLRPVRQQPMGASSGPIHSMAPCLTHQFPALSLLLVALRGEVDGMRRRKTIRAEILTCGFTSTSRPHLKQRTENWRSCCMYELV